MTIGKRMFRVARANLNDLIDKLRSVAGWDEEEEAPAEGDDGRAQEAPRPRPQRTKTSAKDPFLEEAERELEEAIRGTRNGRAPSARVGPRPEVRSTDSEARRWVEERQGRRPTNARRPTGNTGPGRSSSSSQIAQYYATLNLPNGASLERVKESYRRLMRDYHPDRYVNDPGRHRVATEVSQRLSRAYMELRRHLGDH